MGVESGGFGEEQERERNPPSNWKSEIPGVQVSTPFSGTVAGRVTVNSEPLPAPLAPRRFRLTKGQRRRLTIDSIYSTILAMNIALTKHFEELIERLVASGRYNNSSEVVRAGLRILDAEERALSAAAYPPGSLKHLYTLTENRAERRTAKASTLKVEPE